MSIRTRRLPPSTIRSFSLDDLDAFTRDDGFPPGASSDVRTLFTQRDEVHAALKWLIGLAKQSIVLTMFGYADDDLDDLIRDKLESEHVFVQLSLDDSQLKTGRTEQQVLGQWNNDQLSNSVAIGHAAEGGYAHMKAGVIDGRIVFDGSTNWSISGQGGDRGQNNSLVVIDNLAAAVTYRTQLDIDHDTMLKQMWRRSMTAAQAVAAAGARARAARSARSASRRRATRARRAS
jgi:phosphatidylserine/phosphatidylglycerophosphate/cardiolipin synthase-like enzyme